MPTSIPEAKRALRERVLANRGDLGAADLASTAAAIRDTVLAMPEINAAQRVAAYVAVGREPGTGPLIEALSENGAEVLLPILQSDRDLDWAVYEGPQSLVPAARGLLEPDGPPLGTSAVGAADVIIVPGLAVDRSGWRLGRGGGSYDRVLARVLGSAFTCVALHDGEVIDMPVPREPHDVPVGAAVTASRVHHFG